jgi:hypothetical protein
LAVSSHLPGQCRAKLQWQRAALRRGCLLSNSASGAVVLGSRLSIRAFSSMKLTHRLRIRWAAVAALALLIAQMGALAHAYSHVPQTRSVSAQQPIPATHDFCADCLNFAPLLAAAGSPAVAPLALPQGGHAASPAPLCSLVDLKTLLGFRSRAPPVTP